MSKRAIWRSGIEKGTLSRVPRKPRIETPNGIYHVVAKGNGGAEIVLDDADRRRFLERLGRAIERHDWTCFAFCLLDNHFHLVVRTPEPNLGVGMKWLKSSYARDFNHRHGRYGHVFRARYFSELVMRDEHLLSAIVYVALNPVRAGLVERPEDWRWSSYAATIGLAPPRPGLDGAPSLEFFGTNHLRHDTASSTRWRPASHGRARDSASRGQAPVNLTRTRVHSCAGV